MLESAIVKAGMKVGEAMGYLSVKYHGSVYSLRGFPDVMFFKDGVTKFAEYKRPGEKPTPLQLRWHAILRSKGFDVATITTTQETITFLEEQT